MSVTTRTGDKGRTSLMSGLRVDKDDPRIEILGWIDHCSAQLGLAKCHIADPELKQIIESCQKDLAVISAEVCAFPDSVSRLKEHIDNSRIEKLDRLTARFDKNDKCFCLPGQNPESANLHLARVVTRTLDRRLVTFKKQNPSLNEQLLVYINRLSDLLFVLARKYE